MELYLRVGNLVSVTWLRFTATVYLFMVILYVSNELLFAAGISLCHNN
jgi:hypothetical protein